MSLKVPYGERDGLLIHVDDVPKGLACNCICPSCGGKLVARKGKTNVHHFAHHQEGNCDGETLLHILGKRLLHSRISDAIYKRESLPFQWRCSECSDVHTSDLTAMAASVALERSIGKIQPDVTIFDQHGDPRVAVEIVVTHEPEPSVWEYARENKVDVIVFKITENNLEYLQKDNPLTPSVTQVQGCDRPRCGDCDSPLRYRELYVIEDSCEACSRPVQKSIVKTDVPVLPLYGPEGFNEDEISLAQRAGAVFGMQKSDYFGLKHLANICQGCLMPIGRLYSHGSETTFRLISESPLHYENFCFQCEDRPDNREPRVSLDKCISWNCNTQPDVGKVVCSDHLQSYLRGEQAIPFMGIN